MCVVVNWVYMCMVRIKKVLLVLLWLLSGQVGGVCVAGREDTAMIGALLRVADAEVQPERAIGLFDSAYRLSEAIGYADGAFLAMITKGIKYFELQDYAGYRAVSEAALPWAARASAPDAVAWCLINIGEGWFAEGDYLTAYDYYYRGLQDLNRKTKRVTHTTVNIYNSLGMVHMRLRQYERAYEYFGRARAAAGGAGLGYQLGIAYDNMASWHLERGQADSAVVCGLAELRVGERLGKVDLQAYACARLGQAYVLLGDYGAAMGWLDSAMVLARGRYGPPMVQAAYALGTALLDVGRYDAAEALLQAAYRQTQQQNYRDYYITGYAALARLHRQRGEYVAALAYMDTLLLVKDTLAGAQKATALHHMEGRYRAAEEARVVARQQLMVVVVVAVLVLLVWANRQVGHRRQRAEAAVRAMEQAMEIKMLQASLEGEERERVRLARELHDGIGGLVAAAMLRLSALPRAVPGVETAEAYVGGMEVLATIGGEVRRTAHNMLPEELDKRPLDAALGAYCASYGGAGGLVVRCQCYGEYGDVRHGVALHVYRLVQEVVHNAVRHGGASEVLVQLERVGDELLVTVEDNGIGFDIEAVRQGVGLSNVAARVEQLGGRLRVDGVAGKGVGVYVCVPLGQEK